MTTDDFVLVPRSPDLKMLDAFNDAMGTPWCMDSRDPFKFARAYEAMLSASPQHIGSPLRGAEEVRKVSDAEVLAGCRATYPALFRNGLTPSDGDGPATQRMIEEVVQRTRAILEAAAALSPAPGGSSIPMGVTERERALAEALRDLYAVVEGECPHLLNEDSGGDAALDARIQDALALPTGQPK